MSLPPPPPRPHAYGAIWKQANAIDAGPLDVPLALQPASATAAESGSELEDAQRAALGHRAQSSPALESPKTRGISGTQSARFEGVAEPAPPGPEGQGPSASLRSPSLARRTKSRRSRNTFSSSSGRLSSTTLPRLPEGRQMVRGPSSRQETNAAPLASVIRFPLFLNYGLPLAQPPKRFWWTTP